MFFVGGMINFFTKIVRKDPLVNSEISLGKKNKNDQSFKPLPSNIAPMLFFTLDSRVADNFGWEK